jgi:putative membrane protein (TIGR04086 family)
MQNEQSSLLKFNLMAIFVGVLINYGGNFAVGLLVALPMIFAMVFTVNSPGTEPYWQPQAIAYTVILRLAYGVVALIAGYVAGRMAAADQIKHGGIVGLISAVIDVLIAFEDLRNGVLDKPTTMVFFFIHVLVAALGGYLAYRQAKRKQSRVNGK